MNLREYLFIREISQTDAAAELGIAVNYLNQIAKGWLQPSKKLATRIVAFSRGKIDANTLFECCPHCKRKMPYKNVNGPEKILWIE